MSSDMTVEGRYGHALMFTQRAHGPVEVSWFGLEGSDEFVGGDFRAKWYVTAPNRADRRTLGLLADTIVCHLRDTGDTDLERRRPIVASRVSTFDGRGGSTLVVALARGRSLRITVREDETVDVGETYVWKAGSVTLSLEDPEDRERLEALVGFIRHKVDVHEGGDWTPDDDQGDAPVFEETDDAETLGDDELADLVREIADHYDDELAHEDAGALRDAAERLADDDD